MKIIIPMSGFGERFIKAGYNVPKPLIEIEGKRIIEYVIDMFPGEKDIHFICNSTHLAQTNMAEVIENYCKTGTIHSIPPHKLGPVYAVSQIFDVINDQEEVIVNYCDFTCYWDYQHFKNWVRNTNSDGCIPAYKGFHPHSLGKTNYAYMKHIDNWMLAIQEKKPYTDTKMNEYASSGTYYFKNGKLLKESFTALVSKQKSVNNEYYCSLAFQELVERGFNVSIYEIEYFMQWGTPEDVAEYKKWSDTFNRLCMPQKSIETEDQGVILLAMAGKGSRFNGSEYGKAKPYINISGNPMYVQAVKWLPSCKQINIGMREGTESDGSMYNNLGKYFGKILIKEFDYYTKGQACTCLALLDNTDDQNPVTITACDHAAFYNQQKYLDLLNDEDTDIIVWTTTGHRPAIENPHMYGWVLTSNNDIVETRIKKSPPDSNINSMMIGTFTFKSASIFKELALETVNKNMLVNGEFYVDTCIQTAINFGYKCKVLRVDNFVCWGTPNELRTFEYWQRCFHLWKYHRYNYNNDIWLERTSSIIE